MYSRFSDLLRKYWKSVFKIFWSFNIKINGKMSKKSLSHFLSACPKFHHAWTEAHNHVCKVMAASLYKYLAAHWSLHSETLLSQTGLVLELVPTAIVLQSGRQVSDSDTAALQMSLGRCHSDYMAISCPTKKIAIWRSLTRGIQTPWYTCWKPVWGL